MTTLVARPIRPTKNVDQRHALVATQHPRLMVLMLLFAAGVFAVIVRLALLGILSSGDEHLSNRLTAPRGDRFATAPA